LARRDAIVKRAEVAAPDRRPKSKTAMWLLSKLTPPFGVQCAKCSAEKRA
jgi:hypothetical protein